MTSPELSQIKIGRLSLITGPSRTKWGCRVRRAGPFYALAISVSGKAMAVGWSHRTKLDEIRDTLFGDIDTIERLVAAIRALERQPKQKEVVAILKQTLGQLLQTEDLLR